MTLKMESSRVNGAFDCGGKAASAPDDKKMQVPFGFAQGRLSATPPKPRLRSG
jgi:hypothetical protein